MTDEFCLKPLVWVGSSYRDFCDFPAEVKARMGFGLYLAQAGDRDIRTKAMKGAGPGVIEILQEHKGNAFRTIYTVRFETAVYVLHAFQKKSKSGVSTPQAEIDLMMLRLRKAREIEGQRHDENFGLRDRH